MYAVIATGGKQYRVVEGDVIRIESLPTEVGSEIEFDKVLLVELSGEISVGSPYLEGGKVSAQVLSHGRGKKIRIIKMRRRKHYRRQMGHRQNYTEVRISTIKS